jgi:quercetin dioxygenase-like cupin family protein
MVVGPAQIKPAVSLPYVTEYPGQAYSPQIAVVSGDPERTPISMFIRMRRGALPLHSHTSSYQAVVVQGRMKHWAKDEDEGAAPLLGPGSWWVQPGGDIHTDSCLDDECLLYVHTDGRLDTIVDR